MAESRIQRVASYAFITAEGHVLLSLLNRGPNLGKWTLVGGGIEFGENPRDALFREVFEEAGISLTVEPVLWDVTSHSHAFSEENGEVKNIHFIGIVYRMELPKMLPCKSDGDGFSSDGSRWFKLAGLDLHSVEFPIHPSVERILRRLYSATFA
jgi:8-oxo-dGTP diphosphatase